MKKTDLINFVNNQLGYTKLKTDNTVYSNINRANLVGGLTYHLLNSIALLI